VAAIVKRIGRDRFRLRLSAEEVALLRSLPEQLRSVLAGPAPPDEEPEGLFGDATAGPGAPTAGPDAPTAGPGAPTAGPQDPTAGSDPWDVGSTPPGAPADASGGPGVAPGDPVLERLFPRAYLEPEDVDRDAEYQRLVREDLLEAKLANLDVVTSTLDRGTASLRRWTVDLTEDEAGAWLGALNDLRLALGVRLGITEDFDGDIDPSDPQAPALNVLSYLGWLEENLVDALSSG
jgi:Domain of unknown function (DUF2017)